MSSHDLDRTLSPSERGLWHMDAGAPLNYCVVARIRGGLDETVLRGALAAAQARHPPLRVRVDDTGGPLRFVSDGVGPIPLRVMRGPEASWLPRVEDDLTQRHPAGGPLLRVVLHHHDDNDATTLLMSSHHVIGDGRSGVFMLRDVLQAAGRLLAGDAPGLPALVDTPSMEHRVPAGARGLRGILRNGLFMGRAMIAAARNGRPLPVRQEQEVAAHSRRARIHPLVLDERTTQHLTARCRSEDTTVHGALSAAMILGILADHDLGRDGIRGGIRDGTRGGTGDGTGSGSKLPNVGFGHPVDMRPRLHPPVGESLGFFVSMISFEQRVDPDADLWALARSIRVSLLKGRRRRDDFSVMAMSPRLGRWLGSEKLPPRAFIESWEKHVRGTAGLTNMGRLDIPVHYGPLSLETCHFAFTPSALGQFSASATSIAGQLFWNFTWPDPSMTEAHAETLIGGIVQALENALDP